MNKMACVPSEDSDQHGHSPSLRVFAVRMKKAWVLSYPLNANEDSDQTGRIPRLIWVFAGHTVCFVMRWLRFHLHLQIFATSKLMLGPASSISRDGTTTVLLGIARSSHTVAVLVTITTSRAGCSVWRTVILQGMVLARCYSNDPMFLDRQIWANSADPDQTALRGAVWSGSSLLAIPSASFGHISLW